ncbi:MarR family transcriptional regulator [Dactylosporangium sp. AC04546]|uniref:MarR family winged helix-turn-helix transcriptional regulator n=1 Tax=Dactylosporangium sp. AC04546 TaxID=2862460 RepID=UPI001EDE84EA|nr:MarR family transcriptional regulator [Dactylosporangium sp. AC04546]WVK83942.1 MarR family transcriptional regulator [Dactylosporangium sp. AC04546]
MTSADALIDLLRRFNVEADRFIDVFTRAHGLHRTDMNAIAHIWRSTEPLTPGELAKRLSLSPAATTALIGRLERAGHVGRVGDTEDRRRVHLEMLPSARALALAFFTPLGEQLRGAFAEFSDAELAVTERVLARVLTATTNAADKVT